MELQGGGINRNHGSRRSSIEVRDLTLDLSFVLWMLLTKHFISVALKKCPKIKQLKERMLRRKVKRRQLILGTKVSPTEMDRQESDFLHPAESHVRNGERQKEMSGRIQMGYDQIGNIVNPDSKFADAPIQSLKDIQGPHKPQETIDNEYLEDSMEEHEHNLGTLQSPPNSISNDGSDDDNSVVDIQLIYCQHCEKSYAPATYKKFCQTLDANGVPKCVAMHNKKKRKVYNSAKVRMLFT
jgi:hypothetical protein